MKNFSLKENEFIFFDCFTVKINPLLISVLRQTRSVMSHEGLNGLVSSIKKSSQQSPGIIFAFNSSEAKEYLLNMNRLWYKNYKISEFSPVYIDEKKESYYLFLVAGHRRLEAIKTLQAKYLARIFFNRNFIEAIAIQYEENFHEQIPITDLVNFASYYWVLSKNNNPKLTLKHFAKSIHKSVSWVSNALKFANLPISIQSLIHKTDISKGVNYSILIEFAKFYEYSLRKNLAVDEDLLMSLINHAIIHKYKLSKIKELIEIKKQEMNGQQILFELKSDEVNNNNLKSLRRELTLDITRVGVYIDNTTPFVNRVTEKAKVKGKEVITKGDRLQEKITSGYE